jgi:hypothetical protein
VVVVNNAVVRRCDDGCGSPHGLSWRASRRNSHVLRFQRHADQSASVASFLYLKSHVYAIWITSQTARVRPCLSLTS